MKYIPGRHLIAVLFFCNLIIPASFAGDIPLCKANEKLCFTGSLNLRANPADASGNTKMLASDFGFVDQSGVGWQTNANDVTDGASIPAALQWIVGKAFDPSFVPAAVIHDRYCDKVKKHRVYPWKSTHRMFYQALIAMKVPKAKARLMYYAVYTFGPRWEETDSGNVCRGNLTPFCQQMVLADAPSPENSDPQPPKQETVEELLKKYSVDKVSDQIVDIYRDGIYDNPSIEDDIKTAKIILDATYSTPESEQNNIDQELDFIENLSDTRHPSEGILLMSRDPK